MIAALFLIGGCTTPEPQPAGVSRFVGFSVTPLYPKSYEIIAFSTHSIYGHYGAEELKSAWQKKALLVTNGRRFKSSPLVVHDNETIPYSIYPMLPVKSRSVTGTITLLD